MNASWKRVSYSSVAAAALTAATSAAAFVNCLARALFLLLPLLLLLTYLHFNSLQFTVYCRLLLLLRKLLIKFVQFPLNLWLLCAPFSGRAQKTSIHKIYEWILNCISISQFAFNLWFLLFSMGISHTIAQVFVCVWLRQLTPVWHTPMAKAYFIQTLRGNWGSWDLNKFLKALTGYRWGILMQAV